MTWHEPSKKRRMSFWWWWHYQLNETTRLFIVAVFAGCALALLLGVGLGAVLLGK